MTNLIKFLGWRRAPPPSVDELIAFAPLTIKSVYPSGAERTISVPTFPPAPARFSTMNCWPSRSDSH
jgi:hypothetical protein